MRYPLSSSPDGWYRVFEAVNFELYPGERVGIVGRNGVGKSTLLQLMARIFAPTSGSVVWAPGTSVSLLSLGVGFRSDLTGRENALLSCLLQGHSKNDAMGLLPDIETFCELGQFFDQPVNTYSSGMRARLGFGTALLNRSSVILIDEILGVGDTTFRKKARGALQQQLAAERSVVIVSHADFQIKSLCHRAVWFDAGGLKQMGDSGSVLDAYNSAEDS
jgi:lipopolysaccharide transport system ATP-binding protein